ncbi:MAG: hypothetical protein ABFS86_08125 [Planctomycetota bacterium]
MASRMVASDLSDVIRSYTETRTIEELTAQGKRRVRIVSGRMVQRIIQAIVDDTIARETAERIPKDREWIASETCIQFDRFMKFQADQEAVIRERDELVRKYREQAESASERIDRATARLEEERDGWAEREACLVSGFREKIRRLQEDLAGLREQGDAESQRRVVEIEEERDEARRREEDARELSLVSERSLSRTEAKLAATEAACQGQEREVRRLSDRLDDAVADAAKRESVLSRRYEERIAVLKDENRELAARREADRGDLDDRQEQTLVELREAEQKTGTVEARLATAAERLVEYEEAIERMTAELAEAHRRIDELLPQRDEARDAASGAELDVRRAERKLRRMQVRQTTARSELAEREREVQHLTDELAQADLAIREQAEAHVRGEAGELREPLNSLAMRGNVHPDRAAAGPVEVTGEATDVLVDRIFDADHEMTSNLDSLEVEEVATKSGVSNTIARLRAARDGDDESAS